MWILNESGSLAINKHGLKIFVSKVGSRKEERWEIRIVGRTNTETLGVYENEPKAKEVLREFAVHGNTTFFPDQAGLRCVVRSSK